MRRALQRIYCHRRAAQTFVLAMLINGCGTGPVAIQKQTVPVDVKIIRLGVLPFISGDPYMTIEQEKKHILDTLIEQRPADRKDIEENAENLLTRYVHEALVKRFGEQIVPLAVSNKMYDACCKDHRTDTPRLLVQKLGKQLQTDHMLIGTVWRYRERVGTALGAARPASVSFAVYILEVDSGATVWEAVFDKTQVSLFENILDAPDFFRLGAHWLSAEDFSRYGIERMLRKLP